MPVLRLASLLLFLLFLWSNSATPAAHRRFLLQEEPIFRWNQSQLLAARSESEQQATQRSSLEWRSPCEGASRHTGFPNPCSYALEHEDCQSGGLVEYIQIFYCIDAENRHPRLKIALSFLAISLWLVALFYMLGNTAADYFCSCLERLSQLLRLPPTVAGVTLLPLGNGAADVFASVASIAGSHHGGKVGINFVLGGAVFVGTVVAGLVNILVAGGSDAEVPLDGRCFVRDGVFFLASLGYLTLVLWKGRITVWEALGYLGIYMVYALVVVVWEIWRAREESRRCGDEECGDKECGEYERLEGSKDGLERVITVPTCLWMSQVAIYSHHQQEKIEKHPDDPLNEQQEKGQQQEREQGDHDTALLGTSYKKPKHMTCSKSLLNLGYKASQVLINWPLSMPRTLTIPVVDESRWSRPKAVIAATLAPILLAAVWCFENGSPISDDYPALIAGAAAGIALGLAALLTTVDDRPPRAPMLWITAGFFMIMVWFYVIARELVAALVSLAAILGVDAAILGVTVLAWGNSMGDLVANSTLASGGSAGIQIAIAGCYSTPMFNTLLGLGVSFLIVAARSQLQSQSHSPEGGVYDIPGTGMAMVTVAFLGVAIVMAMAGLAVRGMRPSRSLGVGLIVLYGGYMVVRACEALGVRGL